MKAIVASIAIAISAPMCAGWVVNGSFEFGIDPDTNGTGFVDPEGSGLTGWSIIGEIDYVSWYWRAADGERSIDLNGEAPATIYQWVATVPGETYTLGFAMASNLEHSPATKSMRVSAGSSEGDFSFVPPANATRLSMGWSYRSFEFVADSSLTRIAFESTTPGNGGPALDDITLIPSPSSAAVLVLGTLGWGGRRRGSVADHARKVPTHGTSSPSACKVL